MNITAPADLETEFARQRERLTDTVGTLTSKLEDLDVRAHAEDVLDRAEVSAADLLDRAESGATELIDASTDDDGRPKPVVLIGGAVAVVAIIVLVRRRRAKKAANAAHTTLQGGRA